MAEALPARRALYKKTTDPDDAWVEAVGGEFQAESGVEYEICCVGPSAITTKTFTTSLPWWLSGDIQESAVVAAYRPKGAASLAASYVNLANPGTNDGTTIIPPTLNSDGWLFQDTENAVNTGIDPTDDMSVAVSVSDIPSSSSRSIFGCTNDQVTTRFYLRSRRSDNGNVGYGRGAVLLNISAPESDNVVYVVSKNSLYYNGVSIGSNPYQITDLARPILLGARFNGNTIVEPFSGGIIKAVAIFNSELSSQQVAALSSAMAAL